MEKDWYALAPQIRIGCQKAYRHDLAPVQPRHPADRRNGVGIADGLQTNAAVRGSNMLPVPGHDGADTRVVSARDGFCAARRVPKRVCALRPMRYFWCGGLWWFE